MKINLNSEELKKVKRLLSIKEGNLYAAEIYSFYLNECSTSIDKAMMSKYLRRGLNIEQSFYHSFLEVTDIDPTDEDYYIANKLSHFNRMKKLDKESFISNPYYQTIKIEPKSIDNWRLTYLKYLPYQGFVYDEISVSDYDFTEFTPIGFFETSFPFIAVIENDEIWMSITPHEIATMSGAINHAHGRVLVYGLGLGYFPYMCSVDEKVSKITIIENDARVIKLFKDSILPKFGNANKIEIIEADAFQYEKNISDDEYDYVFVDIWHNVGDGLSLYLKMKHIEKSSIPHDYWIETSLLAYFRRNVLTVIEEYFEGLTSFDYTLAKNENDQIINEIYRNIKDLEMNSCDDIKRILSDEYLKSLATKINL